MKVGDTVEVSSGSEPFDPLEKVWIDGQYIGERPVRRARFFNDDFAVPLENLSLDLALVTLSESPAVSLPFRDASA